MSSGGGIIDEILLATEDNNLNKLVSLLQAVAGNVNLQDGAGKTALMVASKKGFVNIINRLLTYSKVDVNCLDNEGKTALHYACDTSMKNEAQAEEVVKLLLANGADLSEDDFLITPPITPRLQHLLRANLEKSKYEKSEKRVMELIFTVNTQLKEITELKQLFNKQTKELALLKERFTNNTEADGRIKALTQEVEVFKAQESVFLESIKKAQDSLQQAKVELKETEASLATTLSTLESSQIEHEKLVTALRESHFKEQEEAQQRLNATTARLNEVTEELNRERAQRKELEKTKTNASRELETQIQRAKLWEAQYKEAQDRAHSLEKQLSSVVASTKAAASNPYSLLPEFSTDQLREGTGQFSDQYRLGTDGTKFKCTLFELTATLKRYPSDSHAQFDAELTALSRCRHPNIAMIYGFSRGPEFRYTVCEYLENGTLREQLNNASSLLTWEKRNMIAYETSLGMNYIQNMDRQHPYFHLNLKSDNVLLDHNFKPKIAGFGFANAIELQAGSNIYVKQTVPISETPTVCPEYLTFGKVSRKTDVYGYGCIIVELLSSQPIQQRFIEKFRIEFPLNAKATKAAKAAKFPYNVHYYDQAVWGTDIIDCKDSARQTAIIILSSIAVNCVDTSRLNRPSFESIVHAFKAQKPVNYTDAEEELTKECNSCRNSSINARFDPCNHASYCHDCALDLVSRGGECPLCSAAVSKVLSLDGSE